MKIFGGILKGVGRLELKSYTKGLIFGMVSTSTKLRELYPNLAYTDNMIRTMQTCPDWVQLSSAYFVYKPAGEGLIVEPNNSLVDIIHKVANVELDYILGFNYSLREREKLINDVHNSIDQYFKS